MSEVRIIEIHENIFAQKDAAAKTVRAMMTRQKTLFLNVMSAPGSGKTTLLIALIRMLRDEYHIAEMDVDIESSLDAQRVADAAGVPSLQIHNGGLCHIDADMVSRALSVYDTAGLDILFLENIGNLVCPAEFDTGAHRNIMLFSVPEGDDKPLKYPLMFQKSDLILVNKMDTVDYFDFDMDKAVHNIRAVNRTAAILPVSAKRGDGLEEAADWIRKERKALL